MPWTGVEPTPNPIAHFNHYASKNFFLKSKKFLAYLIEHIKFRLILNYFLSLLFLKRTAQIFVKQIFSDPGTFTGS